MLLVGLTVAPRLAHAGEQRLGELFDRDDEVVVDQEEGAAAETGLGPLHLAGAVVDPVDGGDHPVIDTAGLAGVEVDLSGHVGEQHDAVILCGGATKPRDLTVPGQIVDVSGSGCRIELGEPPLMAAYRGAREVGFAVVATTLVVIAVFVPIAFLEGTTGRIFRELAVTVSVAVAVSSFVALSLSAMLCCGARLRQTPLENHGSSQDRVAAVDFEVGE